MFTTVNQRVLGSSLVKPMNSSPTTRGEKKCTNTMPIPLGLRLHIDLTQRRRMKRVGCTTTGRDTTKVN